MFFRPELQIAVQSGKYHIVFKYTFIILFKNQCFTMILERKKHQLKFCFFSSSCIQIRVFYTFFAMMVSGAVEGQFDGQSMCGIVAGSTQIY